MWLALQVNRSVTSINLWGNKIGDEGAKHLGSGLAVRLVVIVPFCCCCGLRTSRLVARSLPTSDPLSSPLLPYAHLILSPLSPILSFRHLYSTHILPCVISFTSSIIFLLPTLPCPRSLPFVTSYTPLRTAYSVIYSTYPTSTHLLFFVIYSPHLPTP